MSINKKIMMFCAVSLIAICVLLAERGTASKENENENVESTVQEHVSTGAAVISSVSGVSVQEAEEDGMPGQKNESTAKNGPDRDNDDSGTASVTNAPEEKNGDAGKGNKKEQPEETKSPDGPERKKGQKAVQGKKEPGVKKDAETGSDSGTNMPEESKDVSVSSVTAAPVPTTEAAKNECVLQITCSAVLEHMDKLKDSAKKMVPADGIILTGTYSFTEGDTAFDVLKKACAERNILIDYVFTPGFSTYYVKGINQLYEFDCGDESGWMYTVNGKKPDYGCSQYEVKKNDDIVFYYTCER